jgi:cell wall-associated NlpC family hydrolase
MPNDLDPRLTPARGDIAARHLEGRVSADHFVDGLPRSVCVSRAPLTRTPDVSASLETELLFGEGFTVYEDKDGWSWGKATTDGYVGYVPSSALSDPIAATHRVRTLSSHIYPEPDLKTRAMGVLYMGSGVAIRQGKAVKGFVGLEAGGWIYARHLIEMGGTWGDPLDVARRFLGAPYVWGGRTVAGIDCSGLVQIALMAAGMACPRDTDMQANGLEGRLPPDRAPRRGDIVYFPGHVGFMVDENNLLHANATHMAVTIDPLAEVIDIVREETAKPPLTCLVRLD